MNKYTTYSRSYDMYDIKKPTLAKFLVSQGFNSKLIKQWMSDHEYFYESINNSFEGDLEDATDNEIEEWAKTEMEFYSEENDWLDESQLTVESLRMQMLAGIITESQYKQKLNEGEGKHIIADYNTEGGTPEVKFARVLADNVMAGYDMGTIEGLYSEGEMSAFKNGDPNNFYAGLKTSKKVFASLPDSFTITAEGMDDESFTFTVKKTGPEEYSATKL